MILSPILIGCPPPFLSFESCCEPEIYNYALYYFIAVLSYGLSLSRSHAYFARCQSKINMKPFINSKKYKQT